MPVETESSTSTSGGSTTVGATVRDGGGPGSPSKTVDISLHLEPAKLEQVSSPSNATWLTSSGTASVTPVVDKDRLSAFWKDVKVGSSSPIELTWQVKNRSGSAFEGASDGLLVVTDRSTGGQFIVRRFCICGNAGRFVLSDKFLPFPGLDSPLDFMRKTPSKKKSAKGGRSAPARKKQRVAR